MSTKLTQAERNAQTIWHRYLTYKSGRYVLRSGFGLCGAYYGDYRPGQRRGTHAEETILEHQAAATNLGMWIHRKFPGMIPEVAYTRMLELLLNHDVVEVDSGDRADDGSLDKSEKAAYEEREMWYYAGEDDKLDGTTLYHDFLLLEAIDGRPSERISGNDLFGQAAFMIDKLEAVLQLAQFENVGIKPSLGYKQSHFGGISQRDQFYADLTNDNSALDSWMAHMFDYCKSYRYFWVTQLIAETAYRDVRGYAPQWTKKILKNKAVRCWPIECD